MEEKNKKIEEKSKKFEWKYVGYFFIALGCLFGVVYLINLLIITKAPFDVAQDNDWIGFWGGILGSIISGVITFIVLKITIDNENQKRNNDKLETEKQRLEDKRMSILPYLNYYVDKSDEHISKELKSPIIVMPKFDSNDLSKYKDENGCMDEEKVCNVKLVLENLGLGIAIEPSICRIEYDGIKDNSAGTYKNITILNTGEKGVIRFKVCLADDKSNLLKIKIGYFNLLRDYYEQEIELDFEPYFVFQKGEDGRIVGSKVKYENARIVSVSKAIITEEPILEKFTISPIA